MTSIVQVVSEKWSSHSVEITLQQDWFLSDGSNASSGASPDAAVWQIPLLVASSTCVSEKAVIMDHKVPL